MTRIAVSGRRAINRVDQRTTKTGVASFFAHLTIIYNIIYEYYDDYKASCRHCILSPFLAQLVLAKAEILGVINIEESTLGGCVL